MEWRSTGVCRDHNSYSTQSRPRIAKVVSGNWQAYRSPSAVCFLIMKSLTCRLRRATESNKIYSVASMSAKQHKSQNEMMDRKWISLMKILEQWKEKKDFNDISTPLGKLLRFVLFMPALVGKWIVTLLKLIGFMFDQKSLVSVFAVRRRLLSSLTNLFSNRGQQQAEVSPLNVYCSSSTFRINLDCDVEPQAAKCFWFIGDSRFSVIRHLTCSDAFWASTEALISYQTDFFPVTSFADEIYDLDIWREHHRHISESCESRRRSAIGRMEVYISHKLDL